MFSLSFPQHCHIISIEVFGQKWNEIKHLFAIYSILPVFFHCVFSNRK